MKSITTSKTEYIASFSTDLERAHQITIFSLSGHPVLGPAEEVDR